MLSRIRDGVLLFAAFGLIVAVLWPENEPDVVGASSESVEGNRHNSLPVSSAEPSPPVAVLSAGPHPYFPLVKGMWWRYLVSGPKELIPAADWTMELVSVPTPNHPGVIAVGFGNKRISYEITLSDDGKLNMAGLPFLAPLRFIGNKAYEIEGTLLPDEKYIIKDGTWKRSFKRRLSYRVRDSKMQIVDQAVEGRQVDMALAGVAEKVIVPAGIYNAQRVDWVSRLEMETVKGKRKVLQELTSEPFRTETAWYAKGVGLVRRRVTYRSNNREDIVFDLVSYFHP